MKNYLIGITMGDPKGIGPEIIAKAWMRLSEEDRQHLIIYGDRGIISHAFEMAGASLTQKQLVTTSSIHPLVQNIDEFEAARAALLAIDAAVADAMSGKITAMVTAPVNKRRLKLINPDFVGHTEYIANATNSKDPVMMFASADDLFDKKIMTIAKRICFSIVTTHMAIKNVASAITAEKVFCTIAKTNEALEKYFGISEARISVTSLNPHAGEGGAFGREEKHSIIPAITHAINDGINCVGPRAADSLFNNIDDFDFDAVVAMYHDQGLIPIKLLTHNRCVNFTVGLPFIRTSPGHGTAEDIAWLGTADETGMYSAIKLTRNVIDRLKTEG